MIDDLDLDYVEDKNDTLLEVKNDSIKIEVKDKKGLISSDRKALEEKGYDISLIDAIYRNACPVNIDEALDYLYKNEENLFTHPYISTSSGLCAICEQKDILHSKNKDSTKEIEEKEKLLKDINSKHSNYGAYTIKTFICEICTEEVDFSDVKIKLACKHYFCEECWLDYLREKIINGKVTKIPCMKHKCTQILDEKFIRSIISSNKELLEKYDKFLNSKKLLESNKKIKFCPFPDCEGYAEKKGMKKYVKCNYGHEFCFTCLQKPHGFKRCSKMIDKGFEEWKSHTLVKRCPFCQYWTEKQEGCNHMTCVECGFQWCWVCEKECVAGHYLFGTCKDLQFSDVNSKEDARNLLCDNCGLFCCFSWIIMKIVFLIIYLTMMPLFYLVVLTKKKDEDDKNYPIYLFIVYYISFLPFFICYEVITITYVAVLSVPAFIICPYYRFLRYIFYGRIFGKLFSV